MILGSTRDDAGRGEGERRGWEVVKDSRRCFSGSGEWSMVVVDMVLR